MVPKVTKNSKASARLRALARQIARALTSAKKLPPGHVRSQVVKLLESCNKQMRSADAPRKTTKPSPRVTASTKATPRPRSRVQAAESARRPAPRPKVADATKEIDDQEEEEEAWPPALAAGSRWRLFALERDASLHHEASQSSIRALQVLERIDDEADPDDRDYRVWCRGIFDDEGWSMLEGTIEAGRVRLLFRDDLYSGMPPFLDIERSKKPQLDGIWRLLRPDGRPAAHYRLREVREHTDTELRSIESEFGRWH